MKIAPKNMILFLSAVVLIMMGVSVYLLNKNQAQEARDLETKKIQAISPSSDSEVIEKEVNDTDFSDVDSEMNDLELELEGY